MLKILQAMLQQYVNQEFPDVQAGFTKRQRNQRSNCQHLLDHGESKGFPEIHVLLLIDSTKASDCVGGQKKLWKILKEMGYQTILPVS